MENTIYNDMDETIGYYSDLVSGYKKLIKEAVQEDDFDQARDLMEQLEEINQWTDNDGLLVLSMNNGMGFTCRPYKRTESGGERR